MKADKIIKNIIPGIENMSELNEKEVIPKHSLLNDNLKKEKVQGEPRDHEASMKDFKSDLIAFYKGPCLSNLDYKKKKESWSM